MRRSASLGRGSPWSATRLRSRTFHDPFDAFQIVGQYRDLFAQIGHARQHFTALAKQP
jgi:hypothetical protein